MIERIPGWLNFLLLFVFYVFLIDGVLLFWEFSISLIGRRATIACLIFAGGYLSKWREKQGGGWRFW